MSEEYEDNSKRKADRIVRIEHEFSKGAGFEGGRDETIEKLTKERDSLKDIVSLSAQKEWENSLAKYNKEREEFLDLVGDPEKRLEMEKILGEVNPEQPFTLDEAIEKLDNARIWSNFIREGIEQAGGKISGISRRAPSGKARIPENHNQRNTGVNNDFKTFIDELYSVKKDPSRTIAEKEEADRMLDSLFLEVVRGINISRRKTGRSLPDYQINQCPKCGALQQMPLGMEFDSCLNCGWQLYSKGSRRT